MTTPDAHSVTPFAQARADLRDLLAIPVHALMSTPPARRSEAGYQCLLTVPLDLAAAGFVVTVKQTDAGWCIDLERMLTDSCMLRLNGEARSYVATLFQLADMAGMAIDDLERTAWREQDGTA